MSLLKVNTVQTDKLQSVAGVNRNSVLQVVSKEVNTETSTTSTSFVDATDMFLGITPTSATSKVLVTFNALSNFSRSSTGNYIALQLLRDSTVIFNPSTSLPSLFGCNAGGATSSNAIGIQPLQFLDSPSTVDLIVYKLQLAVFLSANSGLAVINVSGGKSTITLMEIAQ